MRRTLTYLEWILLDRQFPCLYIPLISKQVLADFFWWRFEQGEPKCFVLNVERSTERVLLFVRIVERDWCAWIGAESPTEIPSEGVDFEEVLGFMDEGIAAIVKSLLDAERTDYYLVGEFSVSKGPDQKLMVRDRAERAREIFEDLEQEEEEPDAIA